MSRIDRDFRIRVGDLPVGRTSLRWTATGELFDLNCQDTRAESPVEIQVDVDVDTHRRVRIAVLAAVEVESPCARCLEPARTQIEAKTQLVFDPSSDAVASNPVWVEETGELDLSSDLREILIIEYPAKPLCDPACAGLCMRCGANLNQSPCSCPEERADPRWSALRSLSSGPPTSEQEQPEPEP